MDDERGATLVGAGASEIAEAGPAPAPPGTRSPFHVAPEVVQHRGLSTASDLYAVGCMLYELLVGSPPFEGPTHLATMMAHVTLQPEPPSMRAPSIPVEVDDLVLWALAKDPAGRPASAEELARQLREWAHGPEEAEMPSPDTGTAAPPPPPAESRPWSEAPAGASDVGRWWALYDGTELITTGRFSRVYRGLHRQTGEWHAIKQLQLPRGTDPGEGLKSAPATQAIQRLFANEMHLLQTLSEEDPPVPRLAAMLQAYRSDEASPAYAMPLMEGTLAARLEREGPLPEATAVRTLVPLAETVGLLHERGIVHCGISPRSVMFDRAGGVHLGGFDRACRLTERAALLEAQHEAQHAVHAVLYVLGDVRFLSPERCRGEDFGQATDVYSLGALLFYMLVGVAPFQRPDEMQIMLDHLSTPPPSIGEWGIEVTPRTQEVIHRALAKSPSARFGSAASMAAALLGEPSALGYRA
jgi:serine/threonine protein kinase